MEDSLGLLACRPADDLKLLKEVPCVDKVKMFPQGLQHDPLTQDRHYLPSTVVSLITDRWRG